MLFYSDEKTPASGGEKMRADLTTAKLMTLGLISAVTMFGSGCAQKVALRNSPDVPAAVGEAKITRDENKNAVVEVDIQHLAPPENLKPPKKVYMAWAQASDGKNMPLGQLTVGADRRVRLKATTPMQMFRIIVTAEDTPTPKFPSPQIVFSSNMVDAS
jgi:hypothetical protein